MISPIQRVAFAACLALLTCIVNLPQLLYPLWFDQGTFAACANELLRGGAMYLDCWEVRGALTPALYAAALAVVDSSAAVRAMDIGMQFATACGLAVLAWRMFASRAAAVTAAVLYTMMFASLNYWATGQAEGFANFFTVAMLVCVVGASKMGGRRTEHSLLAGLCAAALFWLKYPLVLFVILALWQCKSRARLQILSGLAIGIGSGFGLMLVQGALSAWWQHIAYDIATFNNVPLSERWDWFTGLFRIEVTAFVQYGNTPTADWKATVPQVETLGRGYPWLMFLLVLSLAQVLAWRKLRSARVFVWAWLLLGVALNVWQGHSYRYHFVIWLPAMALIAGSTWAGIPKWSWSELAGLQRVIAFAGGGMAVAGMLLTTLPWVQDAWQNIFVERKPLRAIHEESRLREYFAVADFLREKTQPDERIVIFSDVPSVYALSGRRMGTRFPYFRWADEGRAMRDEYANQTLEDLQRHQPRFFVLTKEGFPWPEARFVTTWKSLPAVNAYVEQNYQYVTDVGNFIVFQRR